jgi:hypothetical protein
VKFSLFRGFFAVHFGAGSVIHSENKGGGFNAATLSKGGEVEVWHCAGQGTHPVTNDLMITLNAG